MTGSTGLRDEDSGGEGPHGEEAGRSPRRSELLPGLREARLDAGYSQRVLGQLARVRPHTIGELERLEHGAYMNTAARLAQALGVTVARLRAEPEEERVQAQEEGG